MLRKPVKVRAQFLPASGKIVFHMTYADGKTEKAEFDQKNPLHQAIMRDLTRPEPPSPSARKREREAVKERSLFDE